MKMMAGLGLSLAAGGAATFGSPELLEAWLPSFLLWTRLAAGALGVLAIGHLLREDWLAPVRPPLEAMVRSLPVLILMALPVLLAVETLYPWAASEAAPQPGSHALMLTPPAFRLRALGCLLLWAVLGRALARPGQHRHLSALTLFLLLPTAMLAAQDWVLSRDLAWFASLQSFAIWVEGLAGALALAILAARHAPPRSEGMPGLERALLTLALAVLWLWFTQFIVVWMADRPEEADWYLRRLNGWGWVQLGVALPALMLAIGLAAPPDHGRWRMTAVCLLLLVQHVAYLWWVVRPDAPRLYRRHGWTCWWQAASASPAWSGGMRSIGADPCRPEEPQAITWCPKAQPPQP